jgi:hypothetical protein
MNSSSADLAASRRPPLTLRHCLGRNACTIALFFTEWKDAGENLAVLERRARELPVPIQMSDALPQYRKRFISGRNLSGWNFLGIAYACNRS